MPRALGLALLALALAGCSTPPEAPLLRFTGHGCDELGVPLQVPAAAVAAALPPGLAASSEEGQALVVVAFNRCAFAAGEARQEAWESFVWVSVEPPGPHRLPGATHAYEALHWREAGAVLEAARGVLPGVAAASFRAPAGALVGGSRANLSLADAAGLVALEGPVPLPGRTLDHPPGPCCRTFARGAAGLLAVDYASTDQPQGAAPACTVRTTHPGLRAWLGADEATGPCVRNHPYDFSAEVRALP